jgi:hypothetical protein
MGNKKVILSYPPVGSPWHLPAGIALLAALLEGRGHCVIQRYGHILGLEDMLGRQNAADTRQALHMAYTNGQTISQRYEARTALESLSVGCESYGDTFRIERNNVVYVSRYLRESSDDIAQALLAIQNRGQHLFYPYFDKVELVVLREVRPDVYGISVDTERNVLQALILAAMVKEASPETLVVLGGNFWPRVLNGQTAQGFAPLFQWVDAITYAEGFQPMLELTETLDPRQASGTAWIDGETMRLNPRTLAPFHFTNLPTPVFDSVKQWSPEMVPPLFTTSNCPSHCGFCAIAAASDTFLGRPRMMPPKKLATQMQQLFERYGAVRFDIVDETFTVGQQLALGRELQAIRLPATWQCYLTITDQLLDRGKCEQLYAAGCRAVQLGLESLSATTLDRENKRWNTPDNYGKILANLRSAGIQTHVFLIVGIPGEPVSWGVKWGDYLREHSQNILTIKAGRYRLTRLSPEEMGGTHDERIMPLPDEGRLLHLNRDFRYRDAGEGRSIRKDVEAARTLVEQACREHWAYEVTSTLPWWINRGSYTWEDMERMAAELRARGVQTPLTPGLVDAQRRALHIP